MPKYEAMLTGIPMFATGSDLVDFKWHSDSVTADFALPDSRDHALRVHFDSACIVRILDEMALSTEGEDTPDTGLVPNNFAYVVIGANFAKAQSEVWSIINKKAATHYRFVTGMACLDVLSFVRPTFAKVRRADQAQQTDMASGGS